MAHPGHHRVADSGQPEPASGTSARPRRRPRRRTLAAAAAVAVLAAAAAVATFSIGAPSAVPGSASAADYIDIESDAADGVAVQRVPATGTASSSRNDALVVSIVADLTEFWSTALPPVTGRPFTPLRGGITAVDSSADSGSAPCVAKPADIVGNAYYCPSADGIVYDATTLVPVVLHRYGVGGLITTFAHEFGHAIQARINSAHAGNSGQAAAAATSLTTEARADCDAGTFLAWVMAGRSPHLHLDGGDGGMPLGVIGPLVDFSDPATVQPDDPTAHGLSIDRLTWFLAGYRGGASACVALGGSLVTALGRLPAPDGGAGTGDPPRYPSRRLLLTAADRSIGAFTGRPGTGAPLAHLLDRAAPYGQFAQATVVALTNAPPGDSPGSADPQPAESAAAACFAGSWVRSVFGAVAAGELGGRPGDVDEGLDAVLLQPGATFDSAAAYSDGFRSGRC